MKIKIMMKAYTVDDEDPITILDFLAQFKRACDASGVSEEVAVWIMRTFIKDGPTSSLTAQMASHGDGDSAFLLPKARGEQISTYVEAFNILLKLILCDRRKHFQGYVRSGQLGKYARRNLRTVR